MESLTKINGKSYMIAGCHVLTTNFPTLVKDASAFITECTGDWSRSKTDNTFPIFPPQGWNTEIRAIIWKGTVNFSIGQNNCCKCFFQSHSSICMDDICLLMPVIVLTVPEFFW